MQKDIEVTVEIGLHKCQVNIKCPGEITQEEVKNMVESAIYQIFTNLVMKSLPTR